MPEWVGNQCYYYDFVLTGPETSDDLFVPCADFCRLIINPGKEGFVRSQENFH